MAWAAISRILSIMLRYIIPALFAGFVAYGMITVAGYFTQFAPIISLVITMMLSMMMMMPFMMLTSVLTSLMKAMVPKERD